MARARRKTKSRRRTQKIGRRTQKKELEEKRNEISAKISEQEQIVASNKHKLFGQGAKLKKEALIRIEELK